MKNFGKSQGKGSAITCCMVTCFLLGGLACRSEAQEVNFTTPPENTTVFRGSDVTISCGHVIIPARPVIWIINGTSFDQEEIHNSPLYQQNNSTTPIANSLTVFSINGTTTFQCVVQSTPNKTTSTRGTVTVTVYNESTSGSSIGAIAGGAIGGIVVVIIIIIIIIVVCYFVNKRNKESAYDDTTNLKSPPGTGGTHASEGDTDVITADKAQNDKVVYAAPVQAVNIPHQAAASGEQYAVSTKSVSKTSEEQLPSEHVHDTKKDTQGITYADLQELPTDSKRNTANQQPEVAYSQIA